MKEKNLTSWLF